MRKPKQLKSWLTSWASELLTARSPRVRLADELFGFVPSRLQYPDLGFLEQDSGERRSRNGGLDPVPADIGDSIEQQIRRIHFPCRRIAEKGTTYVIPTWLLRVRGTERGAPALWPSIRIRVPPGPHAKARLLGLSASRRIANQRLHEVILRRQVPSARRRERLLGQAKWIRESLGVVLGHDPVRSAWLAEMIEDPVEFERWALASVWNPFVAEFNRPASLLLRRNSPSLWDQLRLEKGRDGGLHRRSFAEQQPWAAKSLLDGTRAGRKLRKIDRNPANGLPAAARELCCNPDDDACPKSVNFARYLARRRQDSSLDRILGNQSGKNRRIRCLLMEAHAQDFGELISHIRDGPTVVRRQIDRAIMVLDILQDLEEVRTETAFDTATLLVRTMVRDRLLDPARLEPDLLARALVALSANSLAAFAEHCPGIFLSPERTAPGDPETDGALDAGIRAFVRFVGSTRKPQLTTRQLIRFSERCPRIRTSLVQLPERQMPRNWPIVPQLAETCRRLGSDGDSLVPLASLGHLKAEGRKMDNCLANGNWYVHSLVRGQIAIVSVRAPGGRRATLELRPDLAQQSGKWVIRNWRTGGFRGPGNAQPSDVCRLLVKRLVDELDSQCPIPIPESERERRQAVTRLQYTFRAINRDKTVAENMWREFCLRALPRRFSKLTPRELMSGFAESIEENG